MVNIYQHRNEIWASKYLPQFETWSWVSSSDQNRKIALIDHLQPTDAFYHPQTHSLTFFVVLAHLRTRHSI